MYMVCIKTDNQDVLIDRAESSVECRSRITARTASRHATVDSAGSLILSDKTIALISQRSSPGTRISVKEQCHV